MCLYKFVKLVTSSVPCKKIYIEQMFVSVRIQFHNHIDCRHTTNETFLQGYATYIRYPNWNVASA